MVLVVVDFGWLKLGGFVFKVVLLVVIFCCWLDALLLVVWLL